MEHFKMPSNPIICAGALGGPFCVFATTPLRNALTIAAANIKLSFVGCYRESFSSGFLKGWTGGHYFAVAAAPQFVCLGPVYHMFASVLGAPGGVALAGITESIIVHGAEKRNAQMSVNMKGGSIPANRMQNPFNPIGAGFGLHVTRNISAMVGMRVLCDPITAFYSKLLGGKSTSATVAGDFSANIVSACISMPIHQTWNFTVSTQELWDKPRGEQTNMLKQFLRKQYFTPEGKVSSIILRDAALRCAYIATIYTTFVNIERSFVAYWPRTGLAEYMF